MNSKLVVLFALFAILVGCASSARENESIKLHLFGGSSVWWVAVDPRDDRYDTVKVEIRGASESQWNTMLHNSGWPYFQISSTSGRPFEFPLSLRLTADNGEQVIATLNSISSNVEVDTQVQYGGSSSPVTQAPTQPATQAPTVAPTTRPSTAPTTRPSTAPTTRPTIRPTQKPTDAPTEKPTERPTRPPTNPPTQKPTDAPTRPPTSAPTQKPTSAPTQKPTSAPTQKPTTAPTQKPTSAPTQKPTQAPSVDACSIVSTQSEPMKILVPLYVYPGAAWDNLITAANNGAKIIAIINPNSGPNANGPDSSYTTYMRKLTAAGIEMVGYVHTQWGARSISTVNTEIGIYASKYPGVSGIFFDEGSAEASDVSYYRTAYNTVLSKGFVHSILNPGVQPDKQYLDISTNIVIFENYASELSRAKYDSWVKCAPSTSQKAGYQYKFSAIIHTASQSQMSSLITQVHNLGMGLVYITDGAGGCCTYNYLATYFTAQANSIKQLNAA